MRELYLDHTQPPLELVMPYMPQLITTLLYGVGALVFVVYALILARRNRSMLPLYFIAGSLLTIFFEPIVDLLGNALHPGIGQYHLLTTNGHPVPWAVLLGYIWYFAALPLLGFGIIRSQTLTQGIVWKAFVGVVVTAALVEQIPLHYGVWVYYGYQPFKIGYMPSWWIFCNTAAVVVPFLLIYRLYPTLAGWRQAAIILCLPAGAFMGHAAAGWPMYSALGTDALAMPQWLIQLAAIAAVLQSLFVVWVMMSITDVPKTATIAIKNPVTDNAIG